MENEIIDMIKAILNIPCSELSGPLHTPSATVEIYNEEGGIFGDGKAANEIAFIQVDLWYSDKKESKIERDLAVTKLKIAIINSSLFTHPAIHRYFDTTAKKYRATFKFFGIMKGE